MRILLANPRGFCAGVRMATESLSIALGTYGAPVYVYHEIIHNHWVIEQFKMQGAIFVDEIDEVPSGSIVMFSAHGVAPSVRYRAKQLELKTIDATCPLVRKVHDEAADFVKRGFTVFLIGHAGHDEVVGTLGISDQIKLVETVEDVDREEACDPERTAYVTQTTLSVDESSRLVRRLRSKFPSIVGPASSDICFATQNRQMAVRELAPDCDVVIVVGSSTSSNSNRLVELAATLGCRAFLVDGPNDVQLTLLSDADTILVTAGASAPDVMVNQVIELLNTNFNCSIEERALKQERQQFPLPRELRELATNVPRANALPDNMHQFG